MNLDAYRFTYHPAAHHCTTVCIQRGTEAMTFTTYIQGRPNCRMVYRRMLGEVDALIEGNTYYKWCSNNGHVAYKWRKSIYKDIVALKEDMIRLELLPCPDLSA